MKNNLRKNVLAIIFLMSALIGYSQSNLQITFNAGNTALAGADTVYMYAGAGIGNPGNHNQYNIGIYDGLGIMTLIGTNLWSICIEPYQYFSSGTAGPIPGGSFIYNIDMQQFHTPDFSIAVSLNNNGYPFNLAFSPGSPPIITNNSPGQITAAYQNCTLGINDLQISQGVLTNYPNPLVENTRFIYTLKTSGKVLLKVYNAIGQEVRTIVNERQGPNTYSHIWKGDNDSGRILYNGVYYYTLSVDGKTVQTNKLIISR